MYVLPVGILSYCSLEEELFFFNPENHWFKAIKVKDQYCWPVSAGSCTSLSFHTPGARVNYLTRLMYINNAKYIPKPTF